MDLLIRSGLLEEVVSCAYCTQEFVASHFGEWAEFAKIKKRYRNNNKIYSELDNVLRETGSSTKAVTSSATKLNEYQRNQPFLLSVTLYGRCLYLVNKGEVAQAKVAFEFLENASDAIQVSRGIMASNDYDYRHDIGKLMACVAKAGIMIAQGQSTDAIAVLRQGLDIEKTFGYREPSPFYLSLKQCLAAALIHHSQKVNVSIAAEFNNEAQQLYREDLIEHPYNVWSLRGQKALSALSLNRKVQLDEGDNPLRGVSSCCEIGLC